MKKRVECQDTKNSSNWSKRESKKHEIFTDISDESVKDKSDKGTGD